MPRFTIVVDEIKHNPIFLVDAETVNIARKHLQDFANELIQELDRVPTTEELIDRMRKEGVWIELYDHAHYDD